MTSVIPHNVNKNFISNVCIMHTFEFLSVTKSSVFCACQLLVDLFWFFLYFLAVFVWLPWHKLGQPTGLIQYTSHFKSMGQSYYANLNFGIDFWI